MTSISTNIVKWDESLSVDNKVIDEQHQGLFELTNNLLNHYNNKDRAEVINESLNALMEYSKVHFEHEENILKERNYPHLKEHIEKHEDFKNRIDRFNVSASNGELETIDHIIVYLVGWVREHTFKEDLDYKNFM